MAASSACTFEEPGKRTHPHKSKRTATLEDHSTLHFYERREKMLLLATLKAPRNGLSKTNPITMSKELNSAVQKLRVALLSQTADSARKQLDIVLDLLYFPPLTLTHIDQPFAAPLMAFSQRIASTAKATLPLLKTFQVFCWHRHNLPCARGDLQSSPQNGKQARSNLHSSKSAFLF